MSDSQTGLILYNYVKGKLKIIWEKHLEIIVVATLALLVAKVILPSLMR